MLLDHIDGGMVILRYLILLMLYRLQRNIQVLLVNPVKRLLGLGAR